MDEYLDIVNEKDEIVGKGLRSKIYKNGLPQNRYIRYVNILAFNEGGQLLLPKRSMNRDIFSGCYDFSCGEHMHPGEKYDDAARRGIIEELGITNPKPMLLGKLGPKEGVSGFMQIYRITTKEKDLNYDKRGIETLEWHSVNNVIKTINENDKMFKDDLLTVLKWYTQNEKDI